MDTIIPIQNKKDVVAAAPKKKKIAPSAASSVVAPAAALESAKVPTNAAASVNIENKVTAPSVVVAITNGNNSNNTTITQTPAFIAPPAKPARKTFLKYTITLSSVMCFAEMTKYMATYYPNEFASYFNNTRIKHINSKTSKCICSFQSHLSPDELTEVFVQHPDQIVRAALNTLEHVLTAPRAAKKKAGQADSGEHGEGETLDEDDEGEVEECDDA